MMLLRKPSHENPRPGGVSYVTSSIPTQVVVYHAQEGFPSPHIRSKDHAWSGIVGTKPRLG